jgi:hypothetical protein
MTDSRAGTRAAAVDFLRARSADTIPHRNGSLLEHLLATEEILRSWGSAEPLCLAGLCHAAYGTDGFALSLVPLADRSLLAETAGAAVEKIVYLYASCDRAVVYPQLPGRGPVAFRDRFVDGTVEPSEDELRDFVDLTLANELEIVSSTAGTASDGQSVPDWFGPLVAQMATRASPAPRRAVRRILEEMAPLT